MLKLHDFKFVFQCISEDRKLRLPDPPTKIFPHLDFEKYIFWYSHEEKWKKLPP